MFCGDSIIPNVIFYGIFLVHFHFTINQKEKINKGNSLTISMVGEPKCFYQKYSFTCSQNILVLQNNEFINITNSKFLIPIIDNYLKAKGYGYGYPVGKERVLRNKLLLPVDKNNQIN